MLVNNSIKIGMSFYKASLKCYLFGANDIKLLDKGLAVLRELLQSRT